LNSFSCFDCFGYVHLTVSFSKATVAKSPLIDCDDEQSALIAGDLLKMAIETTTPEKEKLREAETILANYLLDNTEKVFEELPEIDQARGLIQEALGDFD